MPTPLRFDDFRITGDAFARWLVRSPGRIDALPFTAGAHLAEITLLGRYAKLYPYAVRARAHEQRCDLIREAERVGASREALAPFQKIMDAETEELRIDEDRWLAGLDPIDTSMD